MPPKLAALLIVGFIVYLFRRDIREKPNITSALWLPTIWLFIIISKTFTQWLAILGLPGLGGSSVEEGSSLDAIVFMGLIALGIHVLAKRQIKLSEVVADNPWLVAFIAYCLLSIVWSDFPFVSFKRWIKILGHPVMVLIIFTEPDPKEALLRLMKRCAYLAFPISILWMKYYPTLGRKGSEWGAMSNVGIAGGKNELGGLCLIFALFFFWHLLLVWRMEKSREKRQELYLTAGLLLMIAFCLQKAHSATSGLSLLLGALTIIFLRFRFVNKQLIGSYAIVAIFIFVLAQFTFDFYGNVVDVTGRGSTIEGRGRLWAFLLASDINPILGAGFESYWLGTRLQDIWALPEFRWHPTQAHNGFLEVYLNLGIVGFLMFLCLIFVTFQKCKANLLANPDWGRLTLSFLVAILAHNWTEAGFKGLGLIFFAFFIIAMNVRQLEHEPFVLSLEETGTEEHAVVALGPRRIGKMRGMHPRG